MTNNKKSTIGLVGLYLLLLIASSLLRQIKYYGMLAVILLAITIIVLIVLWSYLLRNNIVNVTWASMTYEPHSHKNERLFLFSLVTLLSPILSFHDLSLSDIIISVVAIVVAIVGFLSNERRLRRNKDVD
ncbi:hypothetical protein [Enterococcus thailandicus]|uniref:hypothetical protein n=1 Tax=Enterococcus thailandicus TaxID=417368 RepID=UPI0022E6402A|nr:hypothetical protein [Enterococcus thailandicus]